MNNFIAQLSREFARACDEEWERIGDVHDLDTLPFKEGWEAAQEWVPVYCMA